MSSTDMNKEATARIAEWFAHFTRKYVQRARRDAPHSMATVGFQRTAGLIYTEAETHDLAKEAARFEASNRAELLAALRWALPLAEIALEDARQRRLQAGHAYIGAETDRIGLWPEEQESHKCARAALAKGRLLG